MVNYEEAKKIALDLLGEMAYISMRHLKQRMLIFLTIPNIFMQDGFLLLLVNVMEVVSIMVNICLVMIRHGRIRGKLNFSHFDSYNVDALN